MSANWNPPPPAIDATSPRRKPRVLRFLGFSILAALALAGLIFVSLMVWAFYEMGRVEAAQDDARAFAAHADEAACVAETVSRLEACDGFVCGSEANYFIWECLRHGEPTEDFCRGIPDPEEEANDFEWAKDRCQTVQAEEGTCAAALYRIQQHCYDRHRTS